MKEKKESIIMPWTSTRDLSQNSELDKRNWKEETLPVISLRLNCNSVRSSCIFKKICVCKCFLFFRREKAVTSLKMSKFNHPDSKLVESHPYD